MKVSLQDVIARIRTQIPEIDIDTLQAGRVRKVTLIDVREAEETDEGVIPGAMQIPRGQLELKISTIAQDENSEIVLYCAGGTRSLLAADSLKNLGYKNLSSLKGGIKSWKDAGLPLDTVRDRRALLGVRYRAQMNLPQVGERGQILLAKAKVLIVGAGGLGSPVALYLAAAGIGTIGIIDDDKVDLSNLQRQILHNTERVGLHKVESAYLTMKSLNPHIEIKTFRERLTAENVDRIFADYEYVIDGCDNFATRYLVNDACCKHGLINIHGSVSQFEGQMSIFCAPDGPCYRCLYEEPPAGELAPNCAEGGVLGVLPGIIGTIEATEAIKYILNIGKSAVGRLLTVDALSLEFSTYKIQKNPTCSVCSKPPEKIIYQDYVEFCSGPKGSS